MGRNKRLLRFAQYSVDKKRLLRLKRITTDSKLIELYSRYKFSDDEFDHLLIALNSIKCSTSRIQFLTAVVANQQ